MLTLTEIYISVDIEASGAIPGEYSMLSIGACEVRNLNNSFYIELQPISDKFESDALKVCGLSLDELKLRGASPYDAMRKLSEWVKWSANGRKPVFVGFNLGFDWSFINYYFIRFVGENPFGISGLDIKSVWFGRNKCMWKDTSKTHIKRSLQLNIEHTHNALDDAKEQAIIFEKILQTMT
ncbi:MAG: 3'-5' exonuclease [Nitrososphaerales archaeon]